jgi:hypothetical protein
MLFCCAGAYLAGQLLSKRLMMMWAVLTTTRLHHRLAGSSKAQAMVATISNQLQLRQTNMRKKMGEGTCKVKQSKTRG